MLQMSECQTSNQKKNSSECAKIREQKKAVKMEFGERKKKTKNETERALHHFSNETVLHGIRIAF